MKYIFTYKKVGLTLFVPAASFVLPENIKKSLGQWKHLQSLQQVITTKECKY